MALSVRDYYRYSVSHMLQMEHDVAEMYERMRGQSRDRRLRDCLQHHLPRSEQQIANLQRVLDRIGGKPEERGTWGKLAAQLGLGGRDGHPLTQAMMYARRDFHDLEPGHDLLDLEDAIEVRCTEHLAIAGYESLAQLADTLGDGESAGLLRQNRDLAKQTLDELDYAMPSMMGDLTREAAAA